MQESVNAGIFTLRLRDKGEMILKIYHENDDEA